MSKQITATDCKPMIIWDVTILDQTIRVEARSGYWAARKAAKAILGTESVQYGCYRTRGTANAIKGNQNYQVSMVEAAYYLAEMETAEVATETAEVATETAEVAYEAEVEAAIERVANAAPKFYVQTLTTAIIVEADSADMAVTVAAQTLEKAGTRLEVTKVPTLSYGETIAYRAGHRALRSGERTVYWVQRA